MSRPLLATLVSVATLAGAAESTPWVCSFDDLSALPAEWTVTGTVRPIAQGAFRGNGAVVLERTEAEREKPCSIELPSFPVTPGTWDFVCATACELVSPDSSFSGTVTVDILDAAGKSIERKTIADVAGKRPWQLARAQMTLPAAAVSARFSARLNKTIGVFRMDEFSAKPATDAARPSAVDRVVLKAQPVGNLFFPDQERTFSVTVESLRELAPAELTLSWTVSDYWGAEQAEAGSVTVSALEKKGERFRYGGSIDLAGIPVETGRYYEIHATVPLGDGDAYRNWSSFAVLPEAPAKAYAPTEIPFVSRNWDNRISEYLRLVDRVGIRVGGLWGGADPKPPHKAYAPGIDILTETGMALMTGAPGSHAVEHHTKGYELWTEEALRGGVRSFFAAYGDHQPKPIYVTLGNEPNNTGERLKEAVRAYQIVYDEIKKVAPETIVISTSIGATEEYFQLGYQDACDVFDFHTYESPIDIREAIERFKVLMTKYDCVKPVWSTEIGLNAQGMTRQYIAGDMVRKTVSFFAGGGGAMAWFGFLYPDPDAKNVGSTGDAFNMFDSRYRVYGPRLDAIMYTNLINGILVKKVVDERVWEGGINGCLFRDQDGHCFAVLWKDSGTKDVRLPLAGVTAVRRIGIDGRITDLDAAGEGIDLTVSEDPVLLTYDGPDRLAEFLGSPALRIASAPRRLVRGVAGTIDLAGVVDAQQVSVEAPPFWTVVRDAEQPLRFHVTSPASSRVTAGDCRILLRRADGTVASELAWRPDVTGRLDVEIRPVPAATSDGQPLARLVVTNRSDQAETVRWTFALTGEQAMAEGQFANPEPAMAFLADVGEGTVSVPAGGQTTVDIPLEGIEAIRLYHAKATITDRSDSTVASTRVLGGFAAAPKGTPALDGVLDDGIWARATACLLDRAEQFYGFKGKRVWKGADDLSATLRYAWDDAHFYIGVTVRDDVFVNTKANDNIWAGDGLQFLFDPARNQVEKPGKYDAGFAVGTKGPQAWYWLVASTSVRAGLQEDVRIAMRRGDRGDAVYEIAIPWAKLAPFTPGVGANLGACMIVNEDDGPGRASFIGWFGNPHTKQIDTAGDVVLVE